MAKKSKIVEKYGMRGNSKRFVLKPPPSPAPPVTPPVPPVAEKKQPDEKKPS